MTEYRNTNELIQTNLHNVTPATCDREDATPGNTIGWDNIHTFNVAGEGANVVILEHTVWGEYSSAPLYYRANHESMLEDYPDVFIEIGYSSHDGQGLALPLNTMVPGDLLDSIAAMTDYPIYSEDKSEELSYRVLVEDWNLWLESDMRAELETATGNSWADIPGDQLFNWFYHTDNFSYDSESSVSAMTLHTARHTIPGIIAARNTQSN